ncbi:IS1634 family transposase [Sphaerochaeta sp.]|jgi:transposase|uniref:IS1634 family transposase n=1 Tax=Sphaerochaeta sp. TaxID=1972642 RepID=UPI002FC799A6
MFVRKSKVKQNGKSYTYLQLVNNRRDASGKVKTDVILKLGREDLVSSSFVSDMVDALAPYADGATASADTEFQFLRSREVGVVWFLNELWNRLGMGMAISSLVEDRKFRNPVERMVFAMVAGRIVFPGSKLSIEHWVEDKVLVPGLKKVDVHNLYRAMDLLVGSDEQIQHAVFTSVAKEAKLELDLVFLDTTNTYFECDVDESPSGLLKRGRSKDNHPELPIVSIAFAVTKQGIPIRCWTFPGNTSDQKIVDQVKSDLGQWNLGKVIMVGDAGFNSAGNRKVLLRECGDFILGEKLRTGSQGAAVEALHRKGRYSPLANGLQVKNVVMDEGLATERRFVIVKNPDAEKRDRLVRDSIVAEVKDRLEALSQMEGKDHTKAACSLRSHGTFGRYVVQTKGGMLKLDRAKIESEELLDGKFLVSTSNMALDAADVAMGYKQLFEIERVFRDMKNVLEIRPVYHRLDDRIRSHILICWMAMVLVRYAEEETGASWFSISRALDDITAGLIETNSSFLWYTSQISDGAKEIFSKLGLKLPGKVLGVESKV